MGNKPMSDGKKVAFGVFWNGVQLAVNQSFSFIVKLVLAKLLFPEQFGLVGMATVFTGFVQVLNDLGVGAALIQRKEDELLTEHFHTAFWTGMAWSLLLFLVMSLGAGPLASTFYGEEQLKDIIPVLSLGILFGSVNLVNKAQLIRQMNFKKTAFIDSFSSVLSGCLAILLAFLGAGVWALVFHGVAPVLISIPLYFKATGWLPRFIWNKQAFNDVFGFGAFATGSNVLNYLYNNVDYLLIGKLLSSTALGIYSLAFVLTDTFRSRMLMIINRAIYPFYGKHQDRPVTLKKYYLKVVQFNCLLVYPIMLFFIVLGEPFLLNFFGPRWQEAVLPLQILAGSVLFHLMVSGNTALLRGLGKPGLEMRMQMLKALIYVPSLVVGILYYGIPGAAWAILLNKFLGVVIAQYVLRKLSVRITYADLFGALKVPFLASLPAFFLSYLSAQAGFHYLLDAALLFSAYGCCVWLMMKTELKLLIKGLKPAF